MLNDPASPLSLLLTRRSFKPMMLGEPAPAGPALDAILAAAVRVPDHGKLAPWRIILVGADRRDAFRDLCAASVTARDDGAPAPSPESVAAARAFGGDAPLLMIVVHTPVEHPKVPVAEQWLSAGAVCLNALMGAHAQGFGGCWLTGWVSRAATVRDGLGLDAREAIAGILCLGTPRAVPEERPRPDIARIARWW